MQLVSRLGVELGNGESCCAGPHALSGVVGEELDGFLRESGHGDSAIDEFLVVAGQPGMCRGVEHNLDGD